jgi:2-phosphoglycerate kinase
LRPICRSGFALHKIFHDSKLYDSIEDKNVRVLIIGGPPMAGKTTLGRRLAARLRWRLISGDDLSLAARGVTRPETHPALHAMNGIDYREYYPRYSVEELIQHMRDDHEALWEGMRKVIFAHSTWAGPAVVEGWQFYPGQIVGKKLANVRSIWLNPDRETLESRIRAAHALKLPLVPVTSQVSADALEALALRTLA